MVLLNLFQIQIPGFIFIENRSKYSKLIIGSGTKNAYHSQELQVERLNLITYLL